MTAAATTINILTETRELQKLRKALEKIAGKSLALEFNRKDNIAGIPTPTVKWGGMKFRWRTWPHANECWPDIEAPVLLTDCADCSRHHESRAIHTMADLEYYMAQSKCQSKQTNHL